MFLIGFIIIVLILVYLFSEEYRSYGSDNRNIATRIQLPDDPKLKLSYRLNNLTRYVMWRHAMIMSLSVVILVVIYDYYTNKEITISGYTLLGLWLAIFAFKYLSDTVIRYSRVGRGVDLDYQLIREYE